MNFTKAQTNSTQHINTDLFPHSVPNITVNRLKYLVAGANSESIVKMLLRDGYRHIIANIHTLTHPTRRQFSFLR